MIHEQREALDEIIVKIRSGRMTRRSFIERATAIGLASGAAMSLLEACGGGGGAGPNGVTSIVWQSENDPSGTYQTLVDTFNNGPGKAAKVHVQWLQGPGKTDDMLTKYNNMFRAQDASLDIVSVDIIYPAQYGSAGWLADLSDKWPASDRANYLQGPIKGCTYQGKLYAAPYRTDLGLLYYRKDLLKTPPATYDDLTSMSKGIAPSKTQYGYVWQASQYEGLVCNFIEVLHGYGGDVLDANNPKKVIVNSPEANAALTKMVDWVGSISPPAVTTYTEQESFNTWQNGNSAFMRNWPYAYSLSNDATKGSKIPNKFDITSLPYGGSGTVGHSTLGGWNLGINAYSTKQDACWEFIKYMLGSDAQNQGAIKATFTTTLQSVYKDPAVLKAAPLFSKLDPILQNALPRPVSAKYTDLSDSIQRNIYGALKKQMSPADALKTLDSELTKLLAS